jgi:hypothetical protein
VITAAVTKLGGVWFDTEKVAKAVARAERRILTKFGAFVRRGAKTLTRKKAPKAKKAKKGEPPPLAPPRVSRPGEPPLSHLGLINKLILFAYEPREHVVRIGPKRLNKQAGPRFLEGGGETVLTNSRGRKRPANFRPRPFMQPAFDAELPKIDQMWANTVK